MLYSKKERRAARYPSPRTLGRLLTLTALVVLQLWGVSCALAQEIEPRLSLKAYGHNQLPMAFSPDGKIIAINDGIFGVTLWDTATGKMLKTLEKRDDADRLEQVCFTPDGKNVVLMCYPRYLWRDDRDVLERAVRLLEPATGKETAVYNAVRIKRDVSLAVAPPQELTFIPDGQMIILEIRDEAFFLWSLRDRKVRATFSREHLRNAHWVFSPDFRLLASSDGENPIRLWDVASGKMLSIIKGTSGTRWDMVFAPDGKTLIGTSGFNESGRGMMYAWDVATRKIKAAYQQKSSVLTSMIFSPDGRFVVAFGRSGSGDKVIHLLEGITLGERGVLRGAKEHRCALAFSPDGRTLASGCIDGSSLLWDLYGLKEAKPLESAEIDSLWSSLGEQDAPQAFRAIRTLIASSPQSLPFLRKYVRAAVPLPEPPARDIERLLAALDSDDFATRQKADHELKNCGVPAEPALRRALMGHVSLELRKRVKAILEYIEQVKASQELCQLRALEVLEHIGTAEARALLSDLAKGVPEARLTQEAKASLARLAKRPASKP